MTRLEMLELLQRSWPTNKGAWIPGKMVCYRERSLFEDFRDDSWMALLLYGLRGVPVTPLEARVVEIIWSYCASFPDPRLWNNRVAALAGSSRSTGSLAMAAATAVTEASVYGTRPIYQGAVFLRQVRALAGQPDALEEAVLGQLRRERFLPGFGRPIIAEDERIEPLLEALESLGYVQGEFFQVVKSVEDLLDRHRLRLKANVAIYCAAIFSDLGFDSRQCYLMAVLAFSAGMMPCYVDACEKKEGLLFPLDTGSIHYTGPEKRPLKME